VERKWKERYSRKFRCRAVERMNACENIVRLSRDLRVCRSLLYKWRFQLEPENALPEGASSTKNSRESTLRREICKLKRLLADKTVEVDFFRSALQKAEARRQRNDISGEKASTTKSEMPLQGNLSIERMCQLAQVSRAGFYRFLQSHALVEEDMTMRSTIQEIALEHRQRYGYRRVTGELRRRGMMVNHKRVSRMMRADNLLTIRTRELRPATDPDHELEIYANDYRDLEHVVQSLEAFIEHYYNRCGLHSALGYRPPEEFEQELRQRSADAGLAASRVTLFHD
jgi:transposase-like protein